MRAPYSVIAAIAPLALLAGDVGAPATPAPASPVASASRAIVHPRTSLPLPFETVRRADVEVRVVVDGVPVANADVQLGDGSGPMLATAATDRDGIARFDDLRPGPYELWARHQDAVSAIARIEVGAAPAQLSLALAPATSLHGSLVAEGEPAPAGATIELEPLDVDHAVRIAKLDERGQFAIDALPAGHWRVTTDATGYVRDEQVIDTASGNEVAVRLRRAGIASGTVVDATGAPIANAAIVLRAQGVATAQHATFTTPHLRWVHPLAGHRILPVIEAARYGAMRPGTRQAECGQGHCGIDLGNQRGSIIHAAADGEIVTAAADIRGEAGRFVAIDHGDGWKTYYMHLETLRPGLEAGQKVHAGDPLGTLGSTGFALDNPHLHFALSRERYGRTWYVDPEPMLRRAVVLAEPRALDRVVPHADEPAGADEHRRTADAERLFTTDAHGQFRIDGVAPGTYIAAAFAEQLAPGASATFAVTSASETSGIAITLHPGVTVTGRVLGRAGAIDGAYIRAAAGFGETSHNIARTMTDRDGEFTLRSLTGKVTISVTAPGYSDSERVIAVGDADRARHHEDFTLVIEDAQLRGQVLAPDGGSVGGVAVRVVEGVTRRRVTTDASGRFTIDRVAAGDYVVEVAAADYPPLHVKLHSDAWKDVRLEQGGGARLDVRDATSATPLAGARIDATGPGDRTVTATTDAHGLVELRALARGDWTIRVRAPGYAGTPRVVAIGASRVLDTVRLDIARGAKAAGIVRDRYGRRVAGARVTLAGITTVTDRDGAFHFADAPPGANVVEAEAGTARGQTRVELVPGDERLQLTVDLAE